MTDQGRLIRDLEESGQGHVVRRLGRLDGAARERLARQLATFDYALVRRLAARAAEEQAPDEVGDFEPAPVLPLDRPDAAKARARGTGEEAIRKGDVAAFVVAGGQGSRLRFDGPKGCFPIGPVTGKPLFQVHAEKVLASARRYGARIPLCIMTSEANDDDARKFFEDKRFFGLAASDVFFCKQRTLPAFDRQGRFLLEAPHRVFVSPDGHGGSYFALASSGALDDLERRGVRHLSYVQVDNPMVSPVDPLFLGEHVRAGSELSSKVLRKREPLEKLGVFGYVAGRLRVVEYSEIPPTRQRETRPDGTLRYAFGSIAVHVLDVGFARRMAAADLPFHLARKRIPSLDEEGRRGEVEGIKFEHFVFDAVQLARNPVVMEVRREDEFAPVKNFEGEDSPATARAAMAAQHRRWLREAGLAVDEGWAVEVSPLFALDAEELRSKAAGVHPRDGLYLG